MLFSVDPSTISHGIQLAVAPVFLLTAVSAMIGAVAGRLARIVDRARHLEDKLEAAAPSQTLPKEHFELLRLRQRGKLANGCIGLLTLCAILIGLTIMALFLGETTELDFYRIAIYCFLAGVTSFLLALICFLTETLMATHILKFGQQR
jgi:hypothetical protein